MIVAANVARVVVDVMVACVVALSAWTMARYTGHLSATDPKKLISRHVVKVATAHVITKVVLAVYVTSRWGRRPTLVLPFALLAISLTLSALVDLMHAQRLAGSHT